jgi:hypothetical protein
MGVPCARRRDIITAVIIRESGFIVIASSKAIALLLYGLLRSQ